MKHGRLSLVLLSTCLIRCETSGIGSGGGEPEPCTTHLDCEGAEFCVDGTCQSVSCSADTDCAQGLLCLDNGLCAFAECREDADCCSPNEPDCIQTCVDNACHCGECTDGETNTCFRGCHRGVRTCDNGCWAPCDAEPVLPEEVCDDGLDNDCNGQVDEDCTCGSGATRACESPCGPGTQACGLDGTWGPCDGGCCTAGDTSQLPCGNCGFQQGVCGGDGSWTFGELCQGEGACEAGDEDTRDCANCGTQTRSCAADCTWGAWSNCTGGGVCTPEDSQVEGCGTCGTWTLTCNESCQWQPPPTCQEGQVCNPAGPAQVRSCGACGTQTRTCLDACTWGAWSNCTGEGVCETGEVTTEPCGNCGECTRVCNDQCAWDPCGACTGQGACVPSDTENQSCGPDTELGICQDGSQSRQCTGSCTWGSWGSCTGAVYPQAWDTCGNGIDEDCDGEDYELEDEYEPNNTCFGCTWLGDDPDVFRYATMDSASDTGDLYCFNGIDNTSLFHTEVIDVTVSGQPAGMDIDVYLYKGFDNCESFVTLASSVNNSNADESLVWEEGTGGDSAVYIVELINYGQSSCYYDYLLSITGLQ